VKLYIVVNEWIPEASEYELRENLYYTTDEALAWGELDAIAKRHGMELPHDQKWFKPKDDASLAVNDTYYIEEAELDG